MTTHLTSGELIAPHRVTTTHHIQNEFVLQYDYMLWITTVETKL